MSDPNLIILAAGVSSRMKNSAANAPGNDRTKIDATSRPKSLIRIGDTDRPFLDYVLSNARSAGYRDIVLVISEHDVFMKEHFGRKDSGNSYHGLTISYAEQKIPPGRNRPLGTADAVLCGALSRPDWKGARFTVCNSDNIYSTEAFELLRTSDHPHALIAYNTRGLRFSKEQEYNNALLETDDEGFLINIIEKPGEAVFERVRAERGAVDVSMNIFRFSYDAIVPYLASTPTHSVRNEKEIATALNLLLAEHPRSVQCYSFNEFVPDLTSVRDIPGMQKFLVRAFPRGPFDGDR